MLFQFTSESVSAGHPDKICDQISDAVLDAYLAQDPEARVACEVLITGNTCIIAGEITTLPGVWVDAVAVARKVLQGIGYTHPSYGFDAENAVFTNLLQAQSVEIGNSVLDGGAGDQGLMFGYACRETPELMPLPILLSHRLMERQHALRANGWLPWLRPDAKSQVTVAYHNRQPVAVTKVVLSTQHAEGITQTDIREAIISDVIVPVLQQYLPDSRPEFLINPSGSFIIGGPHGDTGLTGRKIIVDTYGGSCPHGGGAFSGKDATKVDRSAAYAARYVARHVVAAGLADRCTVQVSYAIGVAEPTSLLIDTHGTGLREDTAIQELIRQIFDMRPRAIRQTLGLQQPVFLPTAAYGHFGRAGFAWEQDDPTIIAALQQVL